MQTVDLRLLSQVVALPSAEQAANVLEQTSNPFLLVPTFSGIKEGLRDVVPGVVYPFSEQTIVLHLARLDGKQEAIAEAHRKLTELTRSLPEGSWQALKTSHRLKLFIERRALIKTDPSGTMSSAMADLQERVGALQAFGIPNALEVAQVEQKMGFQLNLDPAAIEARAKELEGLFYRVQVPVPQTYYDLPEDARKAFILIGKAMKLLDPPYRIMSNPFGEVFEEMVMGTPAFASLRPYYTRFAGVFDFLRPREHTPYGFLPGMENVARPEGGNLYPQGMTLDDFRKFVPEGSPLDLDYRVLFREDKEKGLVTIPYSQAFARWLSPAADLLEKAAKLLEKDFAHMAGYLRTAVQAFRANEFEKNDRAWVRLTEERMDMVVGAIEDYMDGLRGALTQPSGALLLESKDPIFEERVRNLRKAFPRFEKSLRIEEELGKKAVYAGPILSQRSKGETQKYGVAPRQ